MAINKKEQDYKYKYQGQERQDELGLNWDSFKWRNYDYALGRFMSVDPKAHFREWLSPYNFVQNKPINHIDPDGALDAPIYDEDGNFLGTDDQGLQGKAIVMNKDNFIQGMSHNDALSKSLGAEGLNEGGLDKLLTHKAGLKDRPDWDGKLTKSEADNWWKGKTGEPLFVDQSKIDLPGINTTSFKDAKNNSIYNNFVWGLSTTGKVYGTLKLTLLNSETGKVHIGGSKFLDQYDFTMDGRALRDFATWWGRPGGENDGKSFYIKGYGTATVPVVK